MLRAKRAVEEALEAGRAVVLVPKVESEGVLAVDLMESGFRMSMLRPGPVDVRRLRERLDLSQEQFAMRFGLDLNSVQNWETGRRQPDSATRSYLKVIESLPDQVSQALETSVA